MKTKTQRLPQAQNYSAPAINVTEMVSEGLLCTSNDLNIKDWEREEGGSIDF
jgi:hypothetical protein